MAREQHEKVKLFIYSRSFTQMTYVITIKFIKDRPQEINCFIRQFNTLHTLNPMGIENEISSL